MMNCFVPVFCQKNSPYIFMQQIFFLKLQIKIQYSVVIHYQHRITLNYQYDILFFILIYMFI